MSRARSLRLGCAGVALVWASSAGGAPAPTSVPSPIPAPPQPPRLLLENRFPSPQEVVRHYVERDRWGYVWSGMHAREREALTLWKVSPFPQTAYLIEGYEVIEPILRAGNQARVEVLYRISAHTDGRGARLPLESPTRRVIYELEFTQGAWRLHGPSPLRQPAFIDPKVYPMELPPENSQPSS